MAVSFSHLPVLADPVLQAFSGLSGLPAEGEANAPVLLDCTLGGGGHSALLLAAHPRLRVIGLDRDPTARAAAAERLAAYEDRVTIHAANFAGFRPPVPLVGVLADLGVSSPQLDEPARGFSFRAAGPLDMRMDPGAGQTAAELIDRLEESDLADLIYRYGEERLSRRIARRLVAGRPWAGSGLSTADLAYAVAGCFPPSARRGRIHPATRTFQALRIAVNDELGALEQLLRHAPDWLLPGGLLAVISFHSLEDRLVKTAFLADPRLERLTRRPLVAGEEEQQANPRSRSAKLRVARRVA
jgi:16S rRNA (cytosine1402-N4)-methyltransferase